MKRVTLFYRKDAKGAKKDYCLVLFSRPADCAVIDSIQA